MIHDQEKNIELEISEWHHCYNRGADKRTIFHEPSDYDRFLLLLYTSNGTSPIHLSKVQRDMARSLHFGQGLTLTKNASLTLGDMPSLANLERGCPLVRIAAYSLMPNHFHILLASAIKNGISKFMQKVNTSYSMYYNTKYEHSGVIFQGTYKSKHVDTDEYLQRVISYIHANTLDVLQPNWTRRPIDDRIEKRLSEYKYSSLQDVLHTQNRPQYLILDPIFKKILSEKQLSVEVIINDAKLFRSLEEKKNGNRNPYFGQG